MKINCGPTWEERKERKEKAERARLQEWHDFFAILPRRTGDNKCVFLERIERKGKREIRQGFMDGIVVHFARWVWEYRGKA